jgi:hypothetical protein
MEDGDRLSDASLGPLTESSSRTYTMQRDTADHAYEQTNPLLWSIYRGLEELAYQMDSRMLPSNCQNARPGGGCAYAVGRRHANRSAPMRRH